MQPTFDEDGALADEQDEGTPIIDMPRRRIVRRSVYDLPPPSDPDYAPPEDEVEPRRLRWWQVAGALSWLDPAAGCPAVFRVFAIVPWCHRDRGVVKGEWTLNLIPPATLRCSRSCPCCGGAKGKTNVTALIWKLRP